MRILRAGEVTARAAETVASLYGNRRERSSAARPRRGYATSAGAEQRASGRRRGWGPAVRGARRLRPPARVIMGPDGQLYVTTSNCDGRGRCPRDGDKVLRITRR